MSLNPNLWAQIHDLRDGKRNDLILSGEDARDILMQVGALMTALTRADEALRSWAEPKDGAASPG